jgi:hypothetical protein
MVVFGPLCYSQACKQLCKSGEDTERVKKEEENKIVEGAWARNGVKINTNKN